MPKSTSPHVVTIGNQENGHNAIRLDDLKANNGCESLNIDQEGPGYQKHTELLGIFSPLAMGAWRSETGQL